MKLASKLFMAVGMVGFMASCSITKPITATDNPIGTKVGVATNNCLALNGQYAGMHGQSTLIPVSGGWCFNDRKYGIYEAAMDGGISKVATVDLKVTNYILFQKYELIVTGE